MRWSFNGGALAPPTEPVPGFAFTRPHLEDAVRDRVAALPRVRLWAGCDAGEPVLDGGRVVGVSVRPRRRPGGEEMLAAELVVDATGRGSRTPTWLAAHGYPAPSETRIPVGLRYATYLLPRERGELDGDLGVFVFGTPETPRGGGALAVEGGRWIATVVAYDGDEPPGDLGSFRAYAASLPGTGLAELIEGKQPVSELRHYRFPGSRWRRYDRLPRFPAGYLVLGDAVCSLNPAYGHGMTLAALEATALRVALAARPAQRAAQFFQTVAAILEAPWQLVTDTDLKLRGARGARSPRARLLDRYLTRLQTRARDEPMLTLALLRVTQLLDPPQALLRPAVAGRVLRPRRHRPAGNPDPAQPRRSTPPTSH